MRKSKFFLISCLIILLQISKAFADNCIDRFKSYFDNKQVNLSYSSDHPQEYFVRDPQGSEQDQCKTTFPKLQAYLRQYLSANKSDPSIVTGWNYFAIDNKIVYDYLSTISPDKIRAANDFLLTDGTTTNYTVTNQAKYQPISVVNNQYACYYQENFIEVSGTMHPSIGKQLACNEVANGNALKLAQLVDEKQLVTKLVNTPRLKQVFIQNKVDTTTIRTYQDLTSKLANLTNDELACIDTINGDDTSFAITRLNSDRSIDLKLGLNSTIGACSQVFYPIEIKNVQPKFVIKKIVLLN